jgi:drug/metabolite transporter (DMT)-like permease
MKNTNSKTIPLWAWHVIAFVPLVLAVPNGVIIKTLGGEIDPAWINVLRFLIIAIVMLPFLIKSIPKMTRKNLSYALLQGVTYSIAVTSYVFAVSFSQASYVSVINLGIPILLMLYSVYLTREKVSRGAMIGISIAALGAFTIVGFPLLVGQGFTSELNPVATLLALLNVVSYPFAIIFSRKATDHGLPITSAFGISALVTLTISAIIACFVGGAFPLEEMIAQPSIIIMIAYTALGVSLLARMITVLSYKHLGSAITGGLYYVEGFASIALPIIVLGERMTSEMLFGGILILLGVIVAEARRRSAGEGVNVDIAKHDTLE